MTDQPSVFAVENSNPPLTYEEIQEKYQLAILGKNYFIGTKFDFEKAT